MVGGALNVAAEQVIEHAAYGVLLDRDGNRGPAAAPQNCYATSDDDPDLRPAPLGGDRRRHRRAVGVRCGARSAIRRGRPSPSFASAGRSSRGARPIDAHLAAWCAGRTAADVVDALVAVGVPAAVVVHPSAHLDFDQLHARGFFEQVEHPVSRVEHARRRSRSASPVRTARCTAARPRRSASTTPRSSAASSASPTRNWPNWRRRPSSARCSPDRSGWARHPTPGDRIRAQHTSVGAIADAGRPKPRPHLSGRDSRSRPPGPQLSGTLRSLTQLPWKP